MSLGNAHHVPASKTTAGVWENRGEEGAPGHGQANGMFVAQQPRLGARMTSEKKILAFVWVDFCPLLFLHIAEQYEMQQLLSRGRY